MFPLFRDHFRILDKTAELQVFNPVSVICVVYVCVRVRACVCVCVNTPNLLGVRRIIRKHSVSDIRYSERSHFVR